MNGPQHYAEAERLLGLAATATCANSAGENPEAALLIAEAQVHAMLAQVAITVDTAAHCEQYGQWSAAMKESR